MLTKVVLFPFVLIGRTVRSLAAEFTGLFILLVAALYYLHRTGVRPTPQEIADYTKEHIHELLFYGGFALAVIVTIIKILWDMFTKRPTRGR